MVVSRSKGIPSWQKDSSDSTNPAQNDDPVYSQQEAAINSSSSSSISSNTPEQPISASKDDPVYAQGEAAVKSESPYSQSRAESDQSSTTAISSTEDKPSSRASLLTSASKFLQHEDLRTASLERKTAFLQGKGLTKEEIDGLLAAPEFMPSNSEPAADTATTSATTSPPPIITYPEFLLHAHRPKPLVTRTRIVNAVYATGIVSGALYLANRYLFEPMAVEMASARHELFETAQKGVVSLNERLEKNVSVLPVTRRSGVEDGEDSVVSDPEELFHRDIGVQTSPGFEATDGNMGNASAEDAMGKQASKLQELKQHVKTLSETGKQALEEEEATRSVVGDLQAYLDELAYGGRKSTFSWENEYGSGSLGGRGNSGKVDEIAKFKAEIRSVKGALLSARNFPASSNGILRGK
ncbi:MAG: hypothetical protein GOMPHAMPRED_003568 [Gomphillus americanus]|uniref:Peroxisomal membrane protein PEX14 n=1 Tax=Gomphillus americanus TaxID=1940652 RepID=A0A8H3FIV2_9LECA|nr:MAG: hypothetical protein GOMPHAMPRED_003568 [Gomphillus americanus]